MSRAILWHVERLQKEKDRAQSAEQSAQENYAQSRQTLLSILTRFDDWNGGKGKNLSQMNEGIVQDTLAYLETVFDKSDTNDPRMRDDAAQLHLRSGRIQGYHGRREAARASFEKALALWEQLSRDYPEVLNYRAQRMNCYRSLAFCVGDERQQLQWREKALQTAEEVYRIAPAEDLVPAVDLGQCHHDLACTHLQGKRIVEAEEHFQQAIRMYKQVIENHPDHLGCQIGLADSYNNLGLIYQGSLRLDLAESVFRRADELLEGAMAVDAPNNPASLSRAAVASNRGNLYLQKGKIVEALASFDRGIAWCETLLRREPDLAPARLQLLKLHGSKANTLDGPKSYAEAAAEWKRTADLAEGKDRLTYRL